MFEKTLNRIMQGAKTPEGKVIAILLTLSLALMTWNATSIKTAFATDEEDLPVASDIMADEADGAAEQEAVQEVPAAPEAPAAVEAAEPEPAAEPAAEAPADSGAAVEPAAEEGDASQQAAEPADDEASKEAAPAEKEGDKEKAEETAYPAVTLDASFNGMVVTVDAPEGALPEGAKLAVSSVALTDEQLTEKVEAASGKTAKQVKALKIELADADGKAIQPKADVTVKFENTTDLEGDEFVVYRIKDDSSIEKISTTVPATASQQTFTADELKAYAVAGLVEKAADEADANTDATSEEDEEAVPAEEAEELPAQSFFKTAPNGVTATVVAPEGAFPAGTTMEVVAVPDEDVIDAVEAALEDGKTVKNVAAVDITFKNDEGEEIEPKIPINVSLRSPVVLAAKEPAVVHIDDEGAASVVTEQKATANTMAFTSEEFSIYAIVETGTDARVKVIFKGLNNAVIDSMYVKQNDDMEVVLYDPGAGELENGVYFRGWTTDPNYTPTTEAKTIAQVRTEVAALLPPASDGTEVTYYAMLFKDYRITYLDEKEISLGQEEVTFRADATSEQQPYKVNMAYTVQDSHYHFEGWKVREGSTHIVGYEEGHAYQNNDNITITGNVVFGVNAPKGNWFIFDENGKGATYNAPQFVYTDETPTRPNDANMIRNGYTFDGWYLDKTVADQTSGGTQYDFSQTLTDKTTVYARWIPNTTADYTIIIWKQNLACDGYDFEEAITLNGNVGDTINAVTQQGTGNDAYARINGSDKQYTGFHLKEFNQNVTIKTEGNSVLNVYYDRTEYTLTFQAPNGSYTSNGSTRARDADEDGEYYARSGNAYSGYTYTRVYPYQNDYGQWRWIYRANNGQYQYWSNNESITTYRPNYSTVKTITAKYGQDISSNFPITGYDGYVWTPQDSSVYTTGDVPSIEQMREENSTFHALRYGQGTTIHMYYYTEAIGDEGTVEYQDKSFVEHQHVTIDSNGGIRSTETEDFINIAGYSHFASDPVYDEDGKVSLDESNNYTIKFYYSRNAYSINYMDGKYVDGNGNPLEEPGMGKIGTETGIAFGADISSHNADKPDTAHTPSGYVFEGWYIDSACTQPYEFTTMPEGGITVYAKWRQKQYRVFLHVNYPEGATGNINWGTDEQAMTFRISEGGHVSEPTGRDLAGFAFDGWYLDPEFTQVFNGEAYIINESNVTTPYDKTVDMTDTYNNNGFLENPKFNSDATGYDDDDNPDTPGKDRFWITTKLDIYAKWHSTLEGASGIVVEYDADNDHGGYGAPTDTHTYVDKAKAPAGAASKTTDSSKVFGYWEVQKWENGAWVGTGTKVLPGDTFTVLKANAKVEDLSTPAPNGDTKKYTVQLKAVYIDSEEPTPTHISWYKNDGTAAYITSAPAVINVGVDIPAAPSRDGYTFLGWARVATSTSQDYETAGQEAATWETTPTNYTQNLTESDLYLHYKEDGTYHLGSTSGTAVTQVAPDENLPYHAMFAVWEENDVTISYAVADDSTGRGTVSPTSETIKAASGTAQGSSATPSSETYIFDYWTVDDGTDPISSVAEFVPEKNASGLYEAHTYYAHFKMNTATVTVHHYLKGTTTQVADDETTTKTIGTDFTATPKTTYQEKNLTVDSYNPSQTVTVSADGNVITIYYTLPLTITAKTDSKVYDGQPLNGEYTVTGALSADEAAIEAALGTAPSITNVSESPLNYLTEEEQGEITGIPSYYTVTYTPGTLTITARPVTFTGKSETKEYTGSTITISTVEVTETTAEAGLVEGHEHNVTFSASGIEAGGPYEGTITAKDDVVIEDADGNAVTANYDVTVVNGALTITKTTTALTVSLEGKSYVYDAEAHALPAAATTNAASGTTTIEYSKDGEAWTTDLSSLTATAVADSCTIQVRATNPNYENTATSSADLTITARPVTLTSETAEKPYDGTALTKPTVTGWEQSDDTGFVTGEVTDVKATGSVTTVAEGEVTNTITYTEGEAFKADNYKITKNEGTLKITASEAALVITSSTKNWTYDNKLHKDEVYTVTYDGTGVEADETGKVFTLTTGDVVTITATAAGVTNVSDNAEKNNTYTYTITRGGADASGNYSDVTANVGTLTVDPKVVTITAKDAEKVYDGTALVQPEFTATALEATDDHVFTVVMTEASTITDVGTQANVIATVDGTAVTTGTETAVGNYLVTTVDGELKITKDNVELVIESATNEWTYDGALHKDETYAVTYGGEAVDATNEAGTTFKLENGDVVAITATAAGVTNVSDNAEKNNTYTYTIKRGDTETSGNYENLTAKVGTLKINPKAVTITAKDASKTYDGSALTEGGFTATDLEEGDGHTFTVVMTAESTITNVGTQPNVIATVDGVEVTTGEATEVGNYLVTTADGTLTINPKKVTITAKDASKTYDSKALTQPEFEASALQEGDEHTFAVVMTEDSTITNIGSQPNVIATVDGTAVATGTETAVGNYLVTTANGTLTVNPADITDPDPDDPSSNKRFTVSGLDDVMYNGESQKLMPVITDKTTGNELASTDFTVSYSKNTTDAGTVTVTITAKEGSNYTGQMIRTYKITPRSVTLTSATDSKVYDGTALTNDTVTVSGDGFVEGEGATYNVTGSQTLVGSSDNSFTYSLNLGTTKAMNYIITKALGVLEVTDGTPNKPVDPSAVGKKSHQDKEYKFGETITWNISVTNIYDEPKTITLVEQDGFTLAQSTFTNVEPGATVNTTATHVVTETDIDAGVINNSVQVKFDGGTSVVIPDPVPVTPEKPRSSISVAKTPSAPAAGQTYNVGDTITYTITVTNTGNQTLSNVNIADSMSGISGLQPVLPYATIASLAPGVENAVTMQVTYQVVAGDAGRSLTNTATVTTTDPNDPTKTVTSTVTTPGESVTPVAAPAPAPAAPAAFVPVTPAAAVPATPAAPAATPIANNPTPQAQTINDDGNALGEGEGSWSLFDLIATIVTTILAAIMLIFAFGRNRKDGEEDEQTGEQEPDEIYKRKRLGRVLSVIPAVGAIVLFVLTQDLTQPMAIFDSWSLVFGIIGIINIVLAIVTRKKTKDDEDDEQQQTPQTGFVPAGPASL